MKAWKDGRLQDCTPEEFVRSLQRYAGFADKEFKLRSDPAAHISERLMAAADEIERLRAAIAAALEALGNLGACCMGEPCERKDHPQQQDDSCRLYRARAALSEQEGE
jgi:hypothetical protein